MSEVHITMLGRFEVAVDGRAVSAGEWGRRHATALVKVLALTPHRRLHREQVIDAIWPDDSLAHAVPKLHKAAHFARKATNTVSAIVLRSDMVALFPGTRVTVDVDEFDSLARIALADGDVVAAEQALARYGGELVPGDRYESWAQHRREQLRLCRLDLLRLAGRWADVLEVDPADEAGHLALIRRHADAGDRYAALRQFERLVDVLRRDLGVAPSPEAQQLRHGLAATATASAVELLRSVACDGGVSAADRRCCDETPTPSSDRRVDALARFALV